MAQSFQDFFRRGTGIDIAIVGSGPAGLSAALVLDEMGHRITVFEQFETPRPVGSGIVMQPTGLAVLAELGLLDDLYALGARIDRMVGLSMPDGKEVLNVDYEMLGGGLHGLAVHRAALFEVLFDPFQQRNIDICTNTTICGLHYHGNETLVLLDGDGGTHGPFSLVVDASGAGSRLLEHALRPPKKRALTYGALWGNFDWPDNSFATNQLQQRYVRAHRMIGVLPIGRHRGVNEDQVAFFWSLAADDYGAWRVAGLQSWKEQVLSIWPETVVILEQILDEQQMVLARYGHHTLSAPYGRRIAFIGDAAHATSPQLGQGANMALLDTWALGEALRQTERDPLTHYASLRRWHVRFFQIASLWLTPFYQSDSASLARLRDLLFDPITRMPVARRIVAGLISGMLGNPIKRLGLDRQALENALAELHEPAWPADGSVASRH